MGREIVSIKIDVIFKKFFMENPDILKVFLSDILDIPLDSIRNIQVMNPELPPETEEGKFGRLDLSLDVDGTLVDVEIQLSYMSDFRERTLFYWSKLYTSGLKKGERYGDLKKTIAVNIMDHTIFKNREQYHTEIVAAMSDTHEVFSDKFSIHFFELNKVKAHTSGGKLDRKAVWMEFIKADSEEDLEKVRENGMDIMDKAVNIVFDMSDDTKTRELARWREKSLLDMMSSLDTAKNEGLKIGRQEGVKIGRQEGVKLGRQEGVKIGRQEGVKIGRDEERAAIISKLRLSGMTEEEINRILNL